MITGQTLSFNYVARNGEIKSAANPVHAFAGGKIRLWQIKDTDIYDALHVAHSINPASGITISLDGQEIIHLPAETIPGYSGFKERKTVLMPIAKKLGEQLRNMGRAEVKRSSPGPR